MKRTVLRAVAAALSLALLVCTLTGCTDLLYSFMDYSDSYEDYYGNSGSSGDYGDYMELLNQLYGDYYDYSDNSDYYSDYYYGDGTGTAEATGMNDYSDFYSYLNEYLNSYYSSGDVNDSNYTSPENSNPAFSNNTMTISSNILGEALREQFTEVQGNGKDTVTVMVYMCGSNLESDSGLATADLKEMARATQNRNLRIIVECGGTRKWATTGLNANDNTRIAIQNGSATVLEKNPRASMTDGDTLTDFINFCVKNYPADRNMLILWDHGAGAVDGWGCDEFDYSDTLTIDELGEALYASGVKFDFIGFDACLMSTMEVACVLYDFADYMIASEDYESGYGWEYQNWLTALAENTSTPTTEIGKIICDDFVKESNEGKSAGIMTIVDLSYMKLVYSAWKDFAYAAKDQLLDANFSWETENTSRVGSRFGIEDILGSIISTEANVEDMLAIANAVENVPEAEALISALENAIIYCAANSEDAYMTGLAVTLPYGDSAMYRNIKEIFPKAGFDDEYITFLGNFTSVSDGSAYDWSSWYDSYNGYDSWSDYFTGGQYNDSGYGWESWNGWDGYNSNDYGWSDYDYYDYYSGNSSYDDYDFFDYYDFFSDYFGYGNSGYGSSSYGSQSTYDNGDSSGYGDLFDYIFGY